MTHLKLTRPLAVLDIEATGTSPTGDRIVELAVLRLAPDGRTESRVWRVNPGVPIPAEVSAIHGIRDPDVADCPSFDKIAGDVGQVLADCDVAGFNCLRFDLPLLVEEFLRAGIKFDLGCRRIVDAQRIFHKREPRDLSAAVRFYCGGEHVGAHGAAADVEATLRVLECQLDRYADLPRDVEGLHEYGNPAKPNWVDRTGRLKWSDGEVVLNFGRKKGTPLRDVIAKDPGFVKWLLRADFPRDTKEIVENASAGKWPLPPPA